MSIIDEPVKSSEAAEVIIRHFEDDSRKVFKQFKSSELLQKEIK